MHSKREMELHFVRLDFPADQFRIFERIYNAFEIVFLLESLQGPKELSEISIIGFDPITRITIQNDKVIVTGEELTQQEKIDDPLAPIKRLIPSVKDQRFRYVGGAVGYISYDTINLWENLRSKKRKKKFISDTFPMLELGIYTDGIIVDHASDKAYYFHQGKRSRYAQISKFLGIYDKGDSVGFNFSSPINNVSRNQYMEMVKKAKEFIYRGDIFQVVLSRNLRFSVAGDPLYVYQSLRKINPSPYMYFLKPSPSLQIIGSSPEMLLRVSNSYLETYPIAGTRPIVNQTKINEKFMKELLNDKKEIAEHTMLVDLARNDVGRVSKYGSVNVKDLMTVKRFSHVQHMVTHVSGSLQDSYDQFDAFKALFPAGTVSGAPKIRAMEIIDELEPSKRGPYAGALGYFSSNGSCDFAIILRSLFIRENKAYAQAGAGIVAESSPASEWNETEQKLNAILMALQDSRTCGLEIADN
ncbi:MAG TPA: anthranilate synthase component I family protein [Nitrososphaeraceae archaeon]|nr:anthranilate synthase component I family protein [Nitrososphaeraceae archaeon]